MPGSLSQVAASIEEGRWMIRYLSTPSYRNQNYMDMDIESRLRWSYRNRARLMDGVISSWEQVPTASERLSSFSLLFMCGTV